MTPKHESETQKNNPDDWKVRCGYPSMLVNWTCLCFSVFLCSGTLTLIFVDSHSKSKNSSTQWQSLWRRNEWYRIIILPWADDMIASQLRSFAQTLVYFVWLTLHSCLSSSVPLHPLVGLRPPSKIAQLSQFVSHSFSFILLFYLTMPTVFHSAEVEDTTPEGVLSSCWCSLTLTLATSQGSMGWCGCHEILIPGSTTVLFLSNFSLCSTRLWYVWLSLSNHSFQLISIQCNVHLSDPPRNH